MTTNPELTVALAVVPEIERTERLLDEARKRLREHPRGMPPDAARDSVINDAVNAFQADGKWPANIGRDAAKAYADASAWEAERLARERAKESTELLAWDTRMTYSSGALEHLGTRLEEILSNVRAAAETLGHVRTADAAIKAGGAVVETWGRLQGLVDDITMVRAAQWELLLPRLRPGTPAGMDDERRKVSRWRNEGYGEVRTRLIDVPAFALEVMRSQRYTEAYVLWLATAGSAYVPASLDYFAAEVTAATEPVSHDDHGPLLDYSPHVTAIPESAAPAPTGAERTPELSY
ncbi:hypothetical protein ACIRU3_31450 [Streptomyces sp. NPDC101151]|uniref:hypothetical protein n=1 Tax=Streptomyces sp. NPDC101151 TaxID=3366115 RepID=UPI003801AB11